MGREKNENDELIDRRRLRQIEKTISAKFWTNILSSGKDHGHQDRILKSKQSESQNCAPKYYVHKDHKVEGGYRPVVGVVNSYSLGLSNTLSDLVESVCMAIESPYKVISSEDMLSRISNCNKKLQELEAEVKGTLSQPTEDSKDSDWKKE